MTIANSENQPVIILGAARSGTKLLRSLVAATGCYAEVPFDVNYIWRYGNEQSAHDALPANSLDDRGREFIQKLLPQDATQIGKPNKPFVEKTVSNILRVPFVKAVYPQAKYLMILRDGRDVSESAARCWRTPPQTGYLMAKARVFPWRHCAPYAWKCASTFARRRLGLDDHLRTWGPRYPGIDDDVKRLSLVEVCARQWVASMEYYEQSRHVIPEEQRFELRYEELIGDSKQEIQRLCNFLCVAIRRELLEFANRTIRADRVASRRSLSANELRRVLAIADQTLERWGYGGRTRRLATLAA